MIPTSIRSTLLLCVALVACVLGVYAGVMDSGFLIFDDATHVTENPLVSNGLGLDNIVKAFTEPHASLWVPLTWISFMVDVSVFGMNPFAMRLENIALHAANAVLLFLFLKQSTQQFWPSAAVAALFAIHPINVESVAWITERKNVLCLFFGLLTLISYSAYVRHRSITAYIAGLFFFSAAVLAKPMIVPLPAGLLLLDAWPFKRLTGSNWPRRAIEKLPYMVPTIVSSIMTMSAPMKLGDRVTFAELPLDARVGNALVSYATYLRQLAWPHDLCILYPHPLQLELLKACVAGLILVAITLATWLYRQRFPYALVGWLWFLGMLVPMIGLVQVGIQARADRFVYAAQLGILIAAVWLIADLWGSRPRRMFVYSSVVAGAGLTMATLRQVEYWTNSATLFEHAITVSDRNPLAYASAGAARAQLGDYPNAVSHYQKSLTLAPQNPKIWNQLALSLMYLNRNAEAVEAAKRSLAHDPKLHDARYTLALAYEKNGNPSQAVSELRALIQANPTRADALYRLGLLLANQGEAGAAQEVLTKAAQLRPNDSAIKEALRKNSTQGGR